MPAPRFTSGSPYWAALRALRGAIGGVLAASVAVVLVLAQTSGKLPPTLEAAASPASAPRGLTFTDVTEASGLGGFVHVSGSPRKDYILEVTGSGVAVVDVDGDGRLDIYLINGSTFAALDGTQPAPKAALFRQTSDGRFADVTAATGTTNDRWGQGVCAGDIDNDGRIDLYVTNFGKNRLYRNDGPTFVDVAERAGVAVDSWSTGCAFGDYDRDGDLDLFVAGYVMLDLKHLPPPATPPATGSTTTESAVAGQAAGQGGGQGAGAGGGTGASYAAGARACRYRGERVMCGPRGLAGAADRLFRNNGDGTFADVTAPAGVADAGRLYGFGVAWADLDEDGWLDLLVANDSGPNYVYRNRGNGTFEEIGYRSGAAVDGAGREQAHMGIAVGDYDNDGREDLHITNFADDFNVLYHHDDGLMFTDVSFAAGLGRVTIPFLGWGTDFLDYDNDGWLDLFIANGHVYPEVDRLGWNTSYKQRPLLLHNVKGRNPKDRTFEDTGSAHGPALVTPRASRGSAIGDLDNDGDLDIVINNIDGPPTVLRNDGGHRAGHWLSVQLIGGGTGAIRSAIGATVVCPTGGSGTATNPTTRMRRSVSSGRGQISQSDLRVHFGLGSATAVQPLEVRWPNGRMATYPVDRVDALVVIDQASGAVTYR